MEIESLLKIIELVSLVVVITGLYWKQENKINLLSQKTDMKFDAVNNQIASNKMHHDETINRLILSIDKLENTIEHMNKKLIK